MNAVEKDQADDALVLICLRNEFYKKKFYLALLVYFFSLIVIAILGFVVWYLVRNPTHPLYFVTDELSRIIQDVPKQIPNMPTNDVIAWTEEGLESALSYDFVNYRGQLQSAQKYFNDFGWTSYMDGLKTSNNLLALTERKYIVTAKVANQPKVDIEGILGGAYAYKLEVPVLITYWYPPYDDKSKFQNPVLFTVVVQRQSILTSYKGLAIVQIIGNFVTAPPTPMISPTGT